MTEITVYELAKELDTDSLSLLDKLKQLKIPVKNHMSALSPDQAEQARSALKPADRKGSGAKAVGGKKVIVRAVKKKTDAPEAAVPSRETPAVTDTVATSAGTTATAATTAVTAAAPIAEPPPTPKAAPKALRTPKKESTEGDETATPTSRAKGAKPTVLKRRAKAGEEGHAITERVGEPEGQPAFESHESLDTDGLAADGSTEPTDGSQSAQDASTGISGTRPTARPVIPRKSFLKVVEATKPTGTKVIQKADPEEAKRKAAAEAPGPRGIIKMTKENMDKMAAEEVSRGRGPRDKPASQEDIRFADYRKKEMVFLPKRKRLPTGKSLHRTQITTPAAHKRVVEMHDTISVADLANAMGLKAIDCVKKLISLGQMATANQVIDFDTATLVAAEFKHEVKNVAFKEADVLSFSPDEEATLKPRPPVVTIMGHVDHGKTTLLDAIREANVAKGEAGGITQHIGAYTIDKDGKKITFIDTPGHEAFTAMRARGANATDIVILVVAADDGVMPQTREALSHAQAAKVPIIVALNKIDKPGSNPEKIKQALADLNLLAEDWGGQTMFVPVSALKKQGIPELLEAILLNAEVLDLKANPDTRASGIVLEARVEKGRGPVATVLVRRGTIELGNTLVAGTAVGRVRALLDHLGNSVKKVTPGMAVEILGLEGAPTAGDFFNCTEDDAKARKVADTRLQKIKDKQAANRSKMSLEELFAREDTGGKKELKIVLRADVSGSVEAIRESVHKLTTDKVKVEVIFGATGGVTETDVLLASASSAIIVGFNVRPEGNARRMAEAEGVEIKNYSIIYELIDDIKLAMLGLLEKKKIERFLGRAEVRQVFSVPKIGVIAGSSVLDGKILRNASARLLRDSKIVYEGKLSSLRRFKDDAREVAQGFECGIGLENYTDFKPGDVIEAFEVEMISDTL